jgi:hypothetical protein
MKYTAGIKAYKLQCVGCVIPIAYYVRSLEIYPIVALGFLAGKEVKEAKIGNLGLQDRKFHLLRVRPVTLIYFKKSVSH